MKKIHLICLFLSTFCIGINAQNISSKKWNDLFSYNSVISIKEEDGRIVAATENGIFYYDSRTGEISKLSKANGLHEVKIVAFDYNTKTKIGLVGYQNGSLDVITPDGVTYIVDIPLATGYNGSKKINHISISGDKATVSVGYGVSIFDLKKMEFGDSAFFVNNGVFQSCKEATIFDNKVFAATSTGIKSHELDTTFPVFSTWNTVISGDFIHVDSENALSFSTLTNAFLYANATPTPISQSFNQIKDIVCTQDKIIITDNARVFVFSNSGLLSANYGLTEPCNTATIINSKVYFGSTSSGIKTEDDSSYKPDGPFYNYSYKIRIMENDQLLVSSGGRENRYNLALIIPRNPGFYYYDGTQWIYPSLFKNNTSTLYNVLDAIANPSDPTEVFFTNYNNNVGHGIYKMKFNSSIKDFELTKYYDLGAPNQYLRRPVGFTFDDENKLYATIAFSSTSGTNAALSYYDRATDQFIQNNFSITSNGVQQPLYHENLFWIPLPRTNNFMVYDTKKTDNQGDDSQYILSESNGLAGNAEGSLSVAIDKDGAAWIGSTSGLRILSGAADAIKNNPKAEPIIIEQNGLAEELFRDAQILQIEVDGGNQKWVSVDGGGVYYLSDDGEKILKHFTKANSPLPSNSITDIKVDKKTGKVYFVAYDGIVTYQGDVAEVNSDFGNIMVYPNPVVYSQFQGNVTIRGLAEKTNIRITDTAGNLVHSAVAYGGFYEWNLLTQKGKRAASGVYFVLMTNADGTDTATAKIAVVN